MKDKNRLFSIIKICFNKEICEFNLHDKYLIYYIILLYT